MTWGAVNVPPPALTRLRIAYCTRELPVERINPAKDSRTALEGKKARMRGSPNTMIHVSDARLGLPRYTSQ